MARTRLPKVTNDRYAAIQIDRDQAQQLINTLQKALERTLSTNEHYHDTLDVVLDNHGTLSIEDDGVIAMWIGHVLDYGNDNVNALA